MNRRCWFSLNLCTTPFRHVNWCVHIHARAHTHTHTQSWDSRGNGCLIYLSRIIDRHIAIAKDARVPFFLSKSRDTLRKKSVEENKGTAPYERYQFFCDGGRLSPAIEFISFRMTDRLGLKIFGPIGENIALRLARNCAPLSQWNIAPVIFVTADFILQP